ncbi:MAG: aldo/keto reductase [Bacillota bacterium]
MTGCRIGVGLYALSGAYGPRDPGQVREMLARAIDLGVDSFDTADQYGPAEAVLGEAIRPWRQNLFLSTKVGLTEGGGRNCSPAHIRAACEASLRRLQTDYIDLYQIHFDDPDTPVAETVGALEELVTRGWIRHYGVGHLPRERVVEYIQVGRPWSVMLECSPVATTTYADLRPLAEAHGVRLIAMSGTARGLLTGKIRPGHAFTAGDIRRIDPLFRRSLFASGLRVLARLEELARACGRTPVQVALNWTLSRPGVWRVLVGPSTIAHLEEDLGAQGWRLASHDLEELDALLAREEGVRREQLAQDVAAILTAPLPAAGGEAVADLLYALSGMIDLGWAAEREVLPQARAVLGARRGEGSRRSLEVVQVALAERLPASPATGDR